MATKPFKGVIDLDIRKSTPDWEPYTPTRAPKDAPNVLFILYDDTGLAMWSPFGGRVNMPTLQKLADKGLMYSQWHTTALVLTHPLHDPHRPQSSSQRYGCHHRGSQRLPRRAWPHPR